MTDLINTGGSASHFCQPLRIQQQLRNKTQSMHKSCLCRPMLSIKGRDEWLKGPPRASSIQCLPHVSGIFLKPQGILHANIEMRGPTQGHNTLILPERKAQCLLLCAYCSRLVRAGLPVGWTWQRTFLAA